MILRCSRLFGYFNLFCFSLFKYDGAPEPAEQSSLLSDADNDMTDVITLATYFEDTMYNLDEYFRKVLLKDRDVKNLNPYFLVTYQNIIECMYQWIEDFTRLGIALRSIRNVEMMR